MVHTNGGQPALASTLVTVRSLDEPLAPRVRSRPSLLLQGVLALILGAAAAFLLACVADHFDRSLRDAEELEEATGLPLYAAIPDFKTVRRCATHGKLVTAERPDSTIAEAFRILRTNLRFIDLGRQVRTLGVTSAERGEGKSVVVGNLAVACAQQGDRIVLVDMNLRWPTIHDHFQTGRAPGVTDVLRGEVEWRAAARASGIAGLDILPAGEPVPHPTALLETPRLNRLLESLEKAYDRVLVDLPPVLVVSDAASLFALLEGVLLLARSKVCTLEELLDARDRSRRVGANLLGVIFNGYDARTASRRYGIAHRRTLDDANARRPEKRSSHRSPARPGGRS